MCLQVAETVTAADAVNFLFDSTAVPRCDGKDRYYEPRDEQGGANTVYTELLKMHEQMCMQLEALHLRSRQRRSPNLTCQRHKPANSFEQHPTPLVNQPIGQ